MKIKISFPVVLVILFNLGCGEEFIQVDDGTSDTDTLFDSGPEMEMDTGCEVLVEQPMNPNFNSVASQNFYKANDDWDMYTADDIEVPADGWMIKMLYFEGHYENPGYSLNDADGFDIYILSDAEGLPETYPTQSGEVAHRSIPLDGEFVVDDDSGNSNDAYIHILLNDPIVLSESGLYWISFYPTMDLGIDNQYFWYTGETENNAVAQRINPSGTFGWGSDWVSQIGYTYDMQFTLFTGSDCQLPQ